MASSQIALMRATFDKLSTAQKKAYIGKLREQLKGKKNPEYSQFLSECVQKYNAAFNGSSQTVDFQPQGDIAMVAPPRRKAGLVIFLVFIIIALIVVIVYFFFFKNQQSFTDDSLPDDIIPAITYVESDNTLEEEYLTLEDNETEITDTSETGITMLSSETHTSGNDMIWSEQKQDIVINEKEEYDLRVETKEQGTIEYESSDTNVATVDTRGRITGHRSGRVVITARIDVYIIRYIVVIRKPQVDFIYFGHHDDISLQVGELFRLKLISTMRGNIVFKSSNTRVARVSRSGMITAVGAGTTTITATINGISTTIVIVVTDDDAGGMIWFEHRKDIILDIGSFFDLIVKTNGSGNIRYESSDTSIATVDSGGRITAISAGKVIITAWFGSYYKSIVIIIREPSGQFLYFNHQDDLMLWVGRTFRLKLLSTFRGSAVYTSSDTRIAIVSKTGMITARRPGSAIITATIDGQSTSILVIVSEHGRGGGYGGFGGDYIYITMPISEFFTGRQKNLNLNCKTNLSGNPEWTTSDDTLATVDNSGYVEFNLEQTEPYTVGVNASIGKMSDSRFFAIDPAKINNQPPEEPPSTPPTNPTPNPQPTTPPTTNPPTDPSTRPSEPDRPYLDILTRGGTVPVGTEIELTVDTNIPLNNLTCSSDEPSVASVSRDGFVSFIGESGDGSVTITVSGEGVSDSVEFYVVREEETTQPTEEPYIRILNDGGEVRPDSTLDLNIDTNITGTITYTSSNTSLASVSEGGVVRFSDHDYDSAEVTITASVGGKSDSVTFYIAYDNQNSGGDVPTAEIEEGYIRITNPPDRVISREYQLEVDTNIEGTIVYTSSDPNLATVSEDGVVTLTGYNGNVMITVSVGGKSDSVSFPLPTRFY